jgi:hypothetical protein
MKWILSFVLMCALTTLSWGNEEKESLEGVVLDRADGTVLQVVLEGSKFVVRFYDEEQEPIQVPFDRAAVRYKPVVKQMERTVLLPSDDGSKMKGPKFVRKPHFFKVYLSFFKGESSEAVESYQFEYAG